MLCKALVVLKEVIVRQRCKKMSAILKRMFVQWVSCIPCLCIHEACCDMAQRVSASRRALSRARLKGGRKTSTRVPS